MKLQFLLEKLSHYGISEDSLLFIKSYYCVIQIETSQQFGTNNTWNVADLMDNWRKVRWRHFVLN